VLGRKAFIERERERRVGRHKGAERTQKDAFAEEAFLCKNKEVWVPPLRNAA